MDKAGVDLAAMGELQFDTYYADPLSANVMTAIAENWKTNLGLTVKPLAARERGLAEALLRGRRQRHLVLGRGQRPDRRPWLQLLPLVDGVPDRQQRRPRATATSIPKSTSCLRTPASNSTRPSRMRSTSRPARSRKTICRSCTSGSPCASTSSARRPRTCIVIPAAGGGSYYDAAELWTVTE